MPTAAARIKEHLITPGGKRFVAVDFDSRQLRVVQGERVGQNTRIVRLWAEAIPDGVDTSDPAQIGQHIGRTLKALKIPTRSVIMNVPRSLAVLKPVSLPPGTRDDEIAAMVQFQMEKELPFRPEEAVIDFSGEKHYDAETDTEERPAGLNILVAAVRVPVVDYYRQVALAAKVKLQRLGLRPHANQGCVERCAEIGPDEHVGVVHLTADETEIDVLAGRSLAFSRSAMGKAAGTESNGDASDDEQTIAAMVVEAARSLQSYQTVQRAGRIDRVYVAGGVGVEQQVAEGLSKRMGVPCELLNPAEAMELDGEGNASEFISALGLAIRHSGAGGLPFDFLHPKRPVVRRDNRKARTALLTATAALAAMLCVVAAARYVGQRRAMVDKLANEERKLRKENENVQGLIARVEALEKWRDGGEKWLKQLANISALLPAPNQVHITPSPGFKANGDSITFTLRCTDDDVIAEVLKRLDANGYQVTTSRYTVVSDRTWPQYVYSIDLKLSDLPQAGQIDLSKVRPAARPSDDMPGWPGPANSSNSGSRPSYTPRPSTSQPSGYGSQPSSASRYGTGQPSGESRYGTAQPNGESRHGTGQPSGERRYGDGNRPSSGRTGRRPRQ